jgi:large subunit ribosomal protein L31e
MERKYIIPLRQGWLKVPGYRRTGRAVRDVKTFLAKHMKVEDVRIGRNLNMALWTDGNRNPPHKIEVYVKRFDTKEGSYVRAEVPGKKFEEEDKKVDTKKKSKLQEKLEGMTGQKDTKVSEKMGKKNEEEKVKEEVLKKGVEEKKEKVLKETKEESKEVEEKKREENLVKRADKKEAIKK